MINEKPSDPAEHADAGDEELEGGEQPASQPLFREEALQEHANRLWGQVLVAQPPSARVLTPLFLVIAAAIVWFVTHERYARTETVQGYVTPSVGVSKLSPPRRGIVSEVYAEVGEAVQAGQILMKVSSEEALSDGAEVGAALHQELDVQRRELEEKLSAGATVFEQERVRGLERRTSVERQIEQLSQRRAAAAERYAISQEKVRTSSTLLAKGLVSKTQSHADRDRSLELRAEMQALDSQIVEKRDELARVSQELAAAPLQRREQEADLRLQLSQLASRATELRNRSAFAIKAPVAGQVAAMQAVPGATVEPDVPVAVILPPGGRLEANLFIPTRAMGFVEVGQAVGIKYAAFPYQQFGIQRARVVRLATTILRPEELKIPVPVSEPVYTIVAELEAQSVLAYGKPYPLQLGMLLEGEIVLDRRTVLEWLLEPLYSLRASA